MKTIWEKFFNYIESESFEKVIDYCMYVVLVGFLVMGSLHCYRMFHS